MNVEIHRAVRILKRGGIILYPTDTVWGIGCDATNADAVEKIYRLKGRSDSKSMIILVDDVKRIAMYVERIPEVARGFIDAVGMPLTIIYQNAMNLPENLIAEDGSIAIRVANHEFCRQVISLLDCPIVSTSANLSGEKTPVEFDDISPEIVFNVDLVISEMFEKNATKTPSAIIKIGLKDKVELIRK
ncbi:MAG: threonylcarbamoyl-AMP synthase [Prevotellaceae bacterium]|jgi:L-threonylcarbamoyladenylate synthase|nr:threonylcarbamoyl-AMP synthase [Prevotellaceae bacterium]